MLTHNLTKKVQEQRLKPLSTRLPTLPFPKWNLMDTLQSTLPLKIALLPHSSATEFKLTLLQMPLVTNEVNKLHFRMQHYNVFTHEPTENFCVHSTDVQEEKKDKMYVLEHILDAKKPKSHAAFFLFQENKVKEIVITFGRKNGPSNLAKMMIMNSNGVETKCGGCTEKLFQASKALFLGKEEEAIKILSSENGLEAKKLGGFRSLPMTDEQLSDWKKASLTKLLHCKMVCLCDPAFAMWFNSLLMFVKENQVERVLFLEVGEKDETEYTCGMMGDDVQKVLEEEEEGEQGFDTLWANFGPDQCDRNKGGVVMSKVWGCYQEASADGFSDWDQVVSIDTVFQTLENSLKRKHDDVAE